MIYNEEISFAFTFAQEGDDKVSLDYNDDGNWSSGKVGVGSLIGTKFGVSAPVLIAWNIANRLPPVTRDIMAAMPQSTADAIIGTKFWNAMNCGLLPGGVDLSVNDHGFNAGQGVSVRLLQAIVGAKEDGNCGKLTLAAVAAWKPAAYVAAYGMSKEALGPVQEALGASADGLWGPQTAEALAASPCGSALALCAALYDLQQADYEHIGNPRYLLGWSNRCKARLKAAVGLATKLPPRDAEQV